MDGARARTPRARSPAPRARASERGEIFDIDPSSRRPPHLLVRLAVRRRPRQLGGFLLLRVHLLRLAVQEQERRGVDLRQARAVAGVDAQPAERALFGLEHHDVGGSLASRRDGRATTRGTSVERSRARLGTGFCGPCDARLVDRSSLAPTDGSSPSVARRRRARARRRIARARRECERSLEWCSRWPVR